MTTKWVSPGHSHSPANSDQALAQEAVAQGPGKHWPQMLRCFQAVCVLEREERSSVGQGVGGTQVPRVASGSSYVLVLA